METSPQPAPASSQESSASESFLEGFTVLELLVAIAVLALVVLLVAQIVQSGSAVIAGSRKNLGADAQAREVFSRMAMDISQMPKRADLDAIFSDQSGNKKLFFYSEAPGFTATSTNMGTLSLVGYRIGTNSGLERLGKSLPWSGAGGAVFLTYSSTASTNAVTESTLAGAWSGVTGAAPTYDGSDADYHPLAPAVFRLEYIFQKKDGTYTQTRDATKGFRDISAIIVTLAVLDGDSRKIVSDPSKLADALPSPTASDLASSVLPAQTWQNAVNNTSTFASSAGIPQAAAGRVRIYQRAISLQTP